MSRSETEYLRHILDEAQYLTDAGRDLSWEQFAKDETLKRAFVRSIEVIGEATKNLSDDLRDRHPEVASHGWYAGSTDPRLLRSGLRNRVGRRDGKGPRTGVRHIRMILDREEKA